MKIFLKSYKTDNRIVTIFISFFLWAFSMSAIIGAIIALNNGYFWIPIDINIYPKMFNFINIFYDICWFVISTFILIYGIIILVRAYE